MPNDQKPIKPNATRKQAPRKQNLDNTPLKKAGDGTMTFMVWSIAGTVIAACSEPIFGEGTELAGGGGGGDSSSGPSFPYYGVNSRARDVRFFIDVDSNGQFDNRTDIFVGTTNEAGYFLGDRPSDDQVLAADFTDATDIASGTSLSNLGILRSLPYDGGEHVIISPLTDLLANAGAGVDPQDVLNNIFGMAPEFDDDGALVTGSPMSPIITLEDALDINNYNPVGLDTAPIERQLLTTASIALSEIEVEASSTTNAQRVETLTNSLDTFRDQAMTNQDPTVDLDTGVMIPGTSVDLATEVSERITVADNRGGLPVVADVNEGTPIPMTEDENFVLLDANRDAVSLFGFEDPFGNTDSDGDGVPEDGSLRGVYIEAASMGGDIAVMFGDATNNVALAGADRVVDTDSTLTDTRTIGSATFYFVSAANLDQLVLSPGTDVSGDFQIRFYVHDGEDATLADDATTLEGVGMLEIAVASVNDAPELTVNAVDDAVTEAGGLNNAAIGDAMANGSLTITDPDTGHNAFTFAGNTLQGRAGTSGAFKNANGVVENEMTSDGQIIGTYGTLTLEDDGTWSYALRDDDLDTQGLRAAQMVQDVFEIQLVNVDGTTQTSAIVPITIDVTGADDATTITSPASDFGPFEVVDPSRPGTDDAPTATGTFSASDPDDDITWSASATGANSGLGTVTFVGNRWTFTLTDPAGVRALNDLASGDTTDITFDIAANGVDAVRDLTITLRGAADVTIPAPVINAFTGNIADADPASDMNRPDPVSGNFSAASGSGTVDRWMAVPRAGAIEYGTIEVTGAQWTFTLNNVGRDEINRLDATDAPAQAIFDVTATNTGGASDTATLTIMLQGINDAPELAAIVTDGAVTEAGDDGDTAANGSLTITDPDTGHEAFDFVGNTLQGRTGTSGAFTNAVTGTDAVIVGVYGTLTLSATGTWSYMLDDSDTDTQGLRAAQTEEDVFQIQLVNVDGTGQGSIQTSAPETITITVTGANDDPVIDSTRVANLEISAVPGSLEVIRMFLSDDDDADDTAAWSVASRPNNEATYGRFDVDSNTGLGTFTFTGTGETAFNALSSSVTLTYTVMVTDGSGGTDDESFDIVLQAGADNSPVLGESPNPVKTAIEAGHEVAGTAAMGSFTHTDDDAGQGGFVGGTVHIKTDSSAYAAGLGNNAGNNIIDGTDRGTAVTGTYGTIYLRADGDWYYVLDNANTDVNALPDGASALEDVFDVRIQETVDSNIVSNVLELRIAITGTNDAPTDITASSTTATYNGNEPPADTLVATLTTSDPDTGNTHSYSITGGVDRTVFQIGGANRDQLQFASGVTEADNRDPGSTWTVDVTSTDSDGASDAKTFTITRAGNAFPVFADSITNYDSASSLITAEVSDDNMNVDPNMDAPTATGTLIATDFETADADITYSGAIAQGETNDYGSISVDPNTGDWTFTLSASGITVLNALASATDTAVMDFTVTATDADGGTDTATLSITLRGAPNVAIDEPDIDTPNSGLVGIIMDDDASAHDNTPTPAAMGAITLTLGTDISGLMWSVASASVSGLPAGVAENTDFGTLTLPGSEFAGFDAQFAGDAGTPRSLNWEFTPTDAINALRTTDTDVTITYVITASNNGGDDTGSVATLVINLDGVNDKPELAVVGNNAGVTEAGGANNAVAGTAAANGSLTITDPDVGHEAFTFAGNTLQGRAGTSGAFTDAVTGTDAVIIGTYGTLTLSAAGTWSYALRDDDPDTQSLDGGDTPDMVQDEFEIQLVNVDGTGQGSMQTSAPETITITVTGANDDPVIRSGSVANLEISAVPVNLVGGTRTFLSDDDDAGDTAAWSVTNRPNNEATYGEFLVDPDTGVGTFTFTGTGETAFNALSSSVTLTYTVMVTDGSGGTDDESFDIVLQAGADNSPVLGESPNPVKTAIEAGHEVAGTAAMGSFTHTDDDAGQGGFVGGTVHIKTDSSAYAAGLGNNAGNNIIDGTDRGTAVTGTYGTIYLRADGDWYYVLDNANTDVNALPAGASALEDVFDVRIQETVDSTIVSNVLELRIAITGTNDAPTDITASSITATYNGNEPTADMLVATLTTTDPDDSSGHTYALDMDSADANSFRINNNQLLFASDVTEADNRNPGDDWTVGVTSTDSGGASLTRTFTITRAGNAFPVFADSITNYDSASSLITAEVSDDNMNVDPSMDAPTATGTLIATDFETADADITYSGAIAQGETNDYGSISVDPNTGDWTFTLSASGITVLNALASATDTAVMDFTVTATDADGGTDTATLSITLRGAPNVAIDEPDIDTPNSGLVGTIMDDDASAHDNTPTPAAMGAITLTPGTDISGLMWSVASASVSGLPAGVAENTDFGTLTLPGSAFAGFDAQFAGDAGTPRSLNWVFTPTDAINALRTTDTDVTITYVITASNNGGDDAGSIATLVINLDGVNDRPELAVVGNNAGVTEAGGANNAVAGDAMANGSLTITDPDVGHQAFTFTGNTLQGRAGTSGAFTDAVTGTDAVIIGTYGTLTLSAAGTWEYALRDDDPDTQGLTAAQTAEDEFEIQLVNVDGTGQGSMQTSAPETITITVTGANDDPVIATDTGIFSTGIIITDDDPVDNNDPDVVNQATVPMGGTEYGNFIATDLDTGDTITWAPATVADGAEPLVATGRIDVSNAGTLTNADARTAADFGALTVNTDGTWSFDPTAAINDLDTGEYVELMYDIQAADGSGGTDTETLTVRLNGETNAAVTSQAVRAFVIVKGVEFRVNTDSGMSPSYQLVVNASSGELVVFSAAKINVSVNTEDANHYSPSNVARLFDDASLTNLDVAAIILEVDTTPFERDERHNFILGTTLDLDVTEDDAADNTARGFLQVTGAADGDTYTYTGGATRDTTRGTYQIFEGIYGELIVDDDGNWTYVLDNTNPLTQALNGGQKETDRFTVFVTETGGAMRIEEAMISITVNGANDAVATPLVVTSQPTDTTVTEDDAADTTATGAFVVTDPPAGATYTYGGVFSGTYGNLTVDANGTWTYTIDNAATATQALIHQQTRTDTITVTITEVIGSETGRSAPQTIDITVTGKDEPLTFVVDNTQTERTITDATTASDDDPDAQTGAIGLNPGSTFGFKWNVVKLADMTTLLEGRTIPANTDFGTISFPDPGGTNFVALGTPFDAQEGPNFSILPLDWSFDPTDAINLLDDGESVVLTYEITATNRGGPTTQNLVITLTGRDDAPEITGGLTGSSAGVNGATGRITATDIDGDTITFADSTNSAYGDLTFSRVGSTDEYEWTLSLNSDGMDALAALGEGDSENMTFSITATGGTEPTTETLTIELTPMLGFAAPSEVASAYMFLPAQGQIELTRGVTPVTSGLSYGVGLTEEAAKMNIEDPTHTVSNRNASPFGSFVLDDDGSWTYTLTAGPSRRATNLDSNGDGAHNHGDSTDVTVWVAVKDASGPAIAQELDIQIKGATFLDGRGTPAHVPLIADPNRATSGEDEYLRGNSNVNDIIHTGEGNNAVTGLSGDDMITLGNGATANDTQIDVLYHRAQFFFDAEDALTHSTNIDRANTIDNFIRNEDQFIFVRFVTAIVSEEILLANADRFRLEATIEQDGNDFTLTGFKFGLTEAGGGISRGYITINYHDDHQVELTTNEVLTKYGLSRDQVTNSIATDQIITGAEVRHNYFGDDMNDSFQILDNIPQALEGIL